MEELRKKLIADCNNSGLPLEALLFVVRDVYRDIDITFQNYLKSQEQNDKKEEEE